MRQNLCEAMLSKTQLKLIKFLQEDLEVPDAWITLAQAKGEDLNQLPMILWQHGLLTIEQLDKVFDWLETQYQPSK